MEKQKVLSFVGAGVLAFWAGKGLINAAMNKVKFVPGQASLDTTLLGQGYLRINWNVTVQNNNPIPITINQIIGAVTYGDVHLSNVSIQNPMHLVPGEIVPTTLRLDIPATSIIQDMFSSIQQNGWFGTFANTIRFRGTLFTSVINVPINTKIAIA